MPAFELNFDSLVGPTHNYAGLSFGNIASAKFAQSKSHPKLAALQGLAKMKFLHDLGLKQAVLPPHPRPNLDALRRLGYTGTPAELGQHGEYYQRLLAAVYSASAMWAANAATVSPSADSSDGLVHFTPANLLTNFHRSLETSQTAAILKQIFPDPRYFVHHDPLPSSPMFADEGAANHMRMSPSHGEPGIQIFAFGGQLGEPSAPRNFPARQTFHSIRALSRLHKLNRDRLFAAVQNPIATDAGVFHNDVIAVANCDVLLCHNDAWVPPHTINNIRYLFQKTYQRDPWIFIAQQGELSLADAVQTYIFNSQLVTLPNGEMCLIAPLECRDHPGVQRFLQKILAANAPIRSVHYLDVRQSMQNGGGPACLRLRVVVTEQEFAAIHPGIIFSNALHAKLIAWVQKHYRDELSPDDLRDPKLIDECRSAIAELEQILNLRIHSD